MIDSLDQHLHKTGLLPPNASIILAVSGGVDSVVLLDLLSQLQASYGWGIAVAHLDHKVRPSSEDDAALVARLANKYGYKYYLGQLDGGETREAALRRARYDFLESIRQGHPADWIVTAHHRDDRIETSVFNTIRGADRYGMTALKPIRGNIVRPLLPFAKGNLIAHAHAHDLEFIEDSTNTDIAYSRNLVRHELLPHATTYDPSFQTGYLGCLDNLDRLNDDIERGLDEVLRLLSIPNPASNKAGELAVDRRGFLKLSPLVQLNLIVHIARQLAPGIGLSDKNLAAVQLFVGQAKTGSSKALSGGFTVRRDYGRFVFSAAPQQVSEEDQIKQGQTLPLHPGELQEFGAYSLGVNTKPSAAMTAEAWLAPQPLYVRNWHKGDRMYPIGLGGSKKLQDIFGDRKIPRQDRVDWPVVVTARNEVVWLPGLAVDSRFVTEPEEDNYHVICEVV